MLPPLAHPMVHPPVNLLPANRDPGMGWPGPRPLPRWLVWGGVLAGLVAGYAVWRGSAKSRRRGQPTIFVAFASPDARQRDFLKDQSMYGETPYKFIDMSVKTPYPRAEWKERVRTRIRRSDGVIALISEHTPYSEGQLWEIECALEEGKEVFGLRAYRHDRTRLPGVRTRRWTEANIAGYFNKLDGRQT